MSTQTPYVAQNENLHFHTGKSTVGLKVDVPKSEKKRQKTRKALADISKSANVIGRSSSKEKSAVHNSHVPKNVAKRTGLTDEEIQKCNEWATEGIEHIHFSGNDLHALQKDIAEEGVKKKVETVISALKGWTQMAYGLKRPIMELEKDPEDFMKLEPEPEVLLPVNNSFSTSVGEKIEDPFLEEVDDWWPFPDHMFNLRLKEEVDYD